MIKTVVFDKKPVKGGKERYNKKQEIREEVLKSGKAVGQALSRIMR
jgi:hypothetical protein